MQRLIEADRLKAYLQEKYVMYDHTLADIDAQPTVDAVEVVRCKDCEYYNGEYKYCVNDIFAKPNGYCSYGKRREDAKIN